MAELSPAAQAIYEAAIERSEYPNDADWVAINTLQAAAQLLEAGGAPDAAGWLLRIAAELEQLDD